MIYDPYSYTVNQVNLTLSRKILVNSIRFTRSTLGFIQILNRIGVISHYLISYKKHPLIHFSIFFYNSTSFFSNVRLISTLSKKIYISLTALRKLRTFTGTTTYILHTSKGLITHREALELKCGGVLLAVAG